MKKSIVFIHLFNGFTGSPNVLATVINELYDQNYDTTVITSFNNKGFLSDVKCTRKVNISYRFKKNLILRLFQFLRFQFLAAFNLLTISRSTIIYINTIQPFLPAIIAKVKGNIVVYHIHEAYPKKSFFSNFLFYVIEISSDKIICVSDYVLTQLNVKSKSKACLIYNPLSDNFIEERIDKVIKDIPKNILMISSAREYKGIFQFCNLAVLLKEYNFVLVCDATKEEVIKTFCSYSKVENLKIFESQKNLHPFYADADIIVNFSIPSQIIETFGLTILEGMSYGIPSIVPPIGGITELVNEGINGFKIDCRETDDLVLKIRLMLENNLIYKSMSYDAIIMSQKFSQEIFAKKIRTIV